MCLRHCVAAFLSDHQQFLKVREESFWQAWLWGMVPSRLCYLCYRFSIYTDFLQTNNDDIRLPKYADGTALVSLLNYVSEYDPDIYFISTQHFVESIPSKQKKCC